MKPTKAFHRLQTVWFFSQSNNSTNIVRHLSSLNILSLSFHWKQWSIWDAFSHSKISNCHFPIILVQFLVWLTRKYCLFRIYL